jgi:hypothetical protein
LYLVKILFYFFKKVIYTFRKLVAFPKNAVLLGCKISDGSMYRKIETPGSPYEILSPLDPASLLSTGATAPSYTLKSLLG